MEKYVRVYYFGNLVDAYFAKDKGLDKDYQNKSLGIPRHGVNIIIDDRERPLKED